MQAVDPQWVDITAVLNKGPLLMSLRQLLWFTSTLSQLGMEKKKKKTTPKFTNNRFKGKIQKYHVTLLSTSYWPKVSHIYKRRLLLGKL